MKQEQIQKVFKKYPKLLSKIEKETDEKKSIFGMIGILTSLSKDFLELVVKINDELETLKTKI